MHDTELQDCVILVFCSILFSKWGIFSGPGEKEERKAHRVGSNTFLLLGAAQTGAFGVSSGIVCSDEEVELELTPLLSGMGVVPGGLC